MKTVTFRYCLVYLITYLFRSFCLFYSNAQYKVQESLCLFVHLFESQMLHNNILGNSRLPTTFNQIKLEKRFKRTHKRTQR